MVRRRFSSDTRCNLRIKNLNKKDAAVAAVYVYKLLDEIDENNSDEYYLQLINLVYSLVENAGGTEKVIEFTESLLEKYITEGKLELFQSDTAEPTVDRFGRSLRDTIYTNSGEIPYRFKNDREISRLLGGRVDIDNIDFLRIYNTEEEDPLKKIINACIFHNFDLSFFRVDEEIPEEFEKLVYSTEKVDFLRDILNLTEIETQFLELLYIIDSVVELRILPSFMDRVKIAKNILGYQENEINEILRNDRKIRRFGFLGESNAVSPVLMECIGNQDFDLYFSDLIREEDCSDSYELDSFQVKEDSVRIMQRFLESDMPSSFIFYGKPGSGKTQFSKSLCKKAGQKTVIFKNETELMRDKSILPRLYCYLSLNHENQVLIIDEADSLLKTADAETPFGKIPSLNKGIVNKMLEESNCKSIWIVNFSSQIDESTKRRFNYSYQFEAMSKEQLNLIARNKLKILELSEDAEKDVLELIGKYNVTGASVDNVIKTIRCMKDKEDKMLLKDVESVLKQNSMLIHGKAKMRERTNDSYDLSVLNTSLCPEEIVNMTENALAFSEKNCSSENSIRMLFYGCSGSGKTELARFIAQKLNKKIILKRASDILGPYVGQSEHNISKAFEEAENTGAILLFDEADSFFADRSNARQSWERTQVNEFLTQMEEFTGILICTTNLRRIMDPAMLRRFHIIVDFKPLTLEGIRKLCDRYFASYDFTEEQLEELDEWKSATPGDFSSLSSRIRFMDTDKISSDIIMEELIKLQMEKEYNSSSGSRIGFGVS